MKVCVSRFVKAAVQSALVLWLRSTNNNDSLNK
jgi:hypothetical protein